MGGRNPWQRMEGEVRPEGPREKAKGERKRAKGKDQVWKAKSRRLKPSIRSMLAFALSPRSGSGAEAGGVPS